jgi:2',3'-cyclic-nucleotide 2'-phosphodiesterase (5'-nucleotidase family)
MGLSTNEFFGGVTSLDGYIKRFYASTTFVITNVDVEGEDSLHDVTSNKLLVRCRVVVKNGVKVGFLNVVPSNLPETAGKANLGNTTMIQFREAVETAISEARREFSQVVTFVVMAGGYDVWQIEALLYGVDAVSVAIVPAFVTNNLGSMTRSITKQNGDKAIIVTGENPLGVAHLKLTYDTSSSTTSSLLKSWNASSLVHLTNATLSDAEVSSKLDFYSKEVVKYKTVKVGNSSEWLVYDDQQILLRNNVTKLGVFYVNALMKSCEGCDVAMVNAGGIRAGIFAGPINFGDVVKVAPFGNFQTTCKMKGSLLLDIVIDSAYRTNTDKTRRFGGHLLFSGLYYSYNPSPKVAKSKVIIEVAILNRKSGKLQLIDPRAFYKVGVQSYLFKGGDGYKQFQDGISNGDIADINEMGVPEDTALYNAITGYPDHLIPNQPDWDSLCKQQMNQPLMSVAAPPSRVCPAIISTASVDFLKVCPTSRDINNCRMQRSSLLSELKVLIGPNASFIGEKEGGVSSSDDPCTSCSGLGVCNRKVCTCYTVSNGPWVNTPLIGGDDCSEVVEPVNSPAILPIVVGAICLCFALFAIGYFQYHWNNKVFKRSSPIFCQIINLGCVLSCFGSFVIAVPYTDATCYTYAVLCDLSFILQFGSLFIKNYRINKIFNNRTMKVVKVTDLDLLQMLGVLLIGAMVVLAFALALDPFQRVPLSVSGYAANACGTKSGSAMGVQLVVILNMLFLSWGCYLSYKTRNVHADFNESFYIFLAIYNYAFFSFFMFPTAYIFSFTSVGGFRNIVGIAMTVPSTLVAVLLFFSKRKNMFVEDEPRGGSGFVMKGAANNKNNNSGASEDDDFTAKQQIIDLKMELSDKEDALKKVITQIMELGGSVDDAYNVSLRRGNPGPTVSIELAAVTNPLNRLDSGFITTATTSNDGRTGSSIFTSYSTASSDVRIGSGVIDRTGSSTMSFRSLPTTKPPTPTKKKNGEVKMLDTVSDGGGVGGQTDGNNNTTNTTESLEL